MNTLTISCDKKHKKELSDFKSKASNKVLVREEVYTKLRDQWMKENEKRFVDEGKLSQWMQVSNYTLSQFCVEILGLHKTENGNMFKGNSDLSMAKLMPCPEELKTVTSPVRPENGENEEQFKARVERHIKKYGHSDWYEWNCAAWGVKWDVDAELCSQSETELTYTFDSAWAPPINFIHKISYEFPNLTFSNEYDEPGMCFRGVYVCKNGKELDETTHEDGYTPECHDCGEEYDDNGECSCTRETAVENHPVNKLLRKVVTTENKAKKKSKKKKK